MKKSVFLLITLSMLWLLSGCSFLQQQQNPSADVNPDVNPKPATISAEQQLVGQFAVQIGVNKEEVKAEEFSYFSLENTKFTIQGFGITNSAFPRTNYQDFYNLFVTWDAYMPADGIEESMSWYLKDDIICKTHLKLLDYTAEELEQDDLEDKNYHLHIVCGKNPEKHTKWAEKNPMQDDEEGLDDFFVEGKTWPYNELANKMGRALKDPKSWAKSYTIKTLDWPYFYALINYELGWYAGIYKKNTDGYEQVWEWHDITPEQCEHIINNYPDLKTREIGKDYFAHCEEMLFEKKYILSAFGIEPVWNIEINSPNIKYFEKNPNESSYYNLETINDDGEIVIEGKDSDKKTLTATFERETCLSDGLGVELPYTVNVVLKDKDQEITYQGCGEEMLDDVFFYKDKTWPYNELAKKLGWELEDAEESWTYTIEAIDGPYVYIKINADSNAYTTVYKKIAFDEYEKLWEGNEVSIGQCTKMINNHWSITSNPDFPFGDCEDRLKNAGPDEVDEIYAE